MLRDKSIIRATQIKWRHLKKVFRSEPESCFRNSFLGPIPAAGELSSRKARGGGAIEIVNNGGLASSVQQTRKVSRLSPIADVGLGPGILSAGPSNPRDSAAEALSSLGWGSLPPPLAQTRGLTETPDPKLTQLAREKTPSTAPMVTPVLEVADLEAPSAVVTLS